MAGNTLTNILPKILARGLLALREQAIMPRLVNLDFGEDAKKKGNTVDIPVSKAQAASDVTAAPTFSSAAGVTPGLVTLPLDQWKHSDFFLTDKEMAEIDAREHFLPQQASEAVRALANTMDTHIHNQYEGVYGYVGTAGITPFSTIATAPEAGKVLNQQLAPRTDRRGVVDPGAWSQAQQLAAFSNFEQTDDRNVKIEGEIGRKFGFDWFMSQNVVTHTAGTAASLIVGSTTAIGVSALDIGTGSSASDGTLLIGDVFTIAGDSQTYVVKDASTNVSVAAVELVIDPALQVIASANSVITLKATHVVNLAFHRDAFAFAQRPLQDMLADSMSQVAVDPMTGLGLRLEALRQFKQTALDYDVLYGALLVRPQFAVRIAG